MSSIFKVECLCTDRQLGNVLRSLAGCAYDVKPTPVTNAISNNGRGTLTVHEGNSDDVLIANMKKSGKKEFKSADIKAIMREMGRAVSSYSHAMNRLVKQKMLKARKVHGRVTWTVV